MTGPDLKAAADQLQLVHAQLLGTLDAVQAEIDQHRETAQAGVRKERDRLGAIARNRAAQAVSEHTLRARDVATSLCEARGNVLDVADYVTIGRLAIPGRPSGVNEEVHAPLVLPLVGRDNIIIESSSETSTSLVVQLVWQALGRTAPGQLDIVGYDPQLSAILAPFSPLLRVTDDALRVTSQPGELKKLVSGLTSDVQRINSLLRGVTDSLIDLRDNAGYPMERYRLIVLLNYPDGVDEETHRQILALAKAAPAAGISFIITTPPPHSATPDWFDTEELETLGAVLRESDGKLRWTAHQRFQLNIAKLSPRELAHGVDHVVEEAASAVAVKVPFTRVQPIEARWTESSADRLRFAIGLAGPSIVEITLGDEIEQRHNILVTGAVGQGKSNLLKVMIHSLCQRYSPSELQMYLLDFKEGVTLFPLAPTPGAEDYLPHAAVLGLESDREFGLAVLRHVEREFARRAKLFRPYGDNLSRYRAAVPDAEMPRIVVVIDEFHMLFDPNDKVAETAAQVLEAVARRGRSYGIHLILASQTVSGISALMTREGGIFAQFPIRLALKNAVQESYATLGQGNDAAARLRVRGEAVLNLEYGHSEANRQVAIAAADDDELKRLRYSWWLDSRETSKPPLVFDGARRQRPSDAIMAVRRLRSRRQHGAVSSAIVGWPVDTTDEPIVVPLAAEPGRNLAIIGAGEPGSVDEADGAVNNAIGVLQGAAMSLALQHPAGDAEFVSLELLDATMLERNGHRHWHRAMELLGYPVREVPRADIPSYLQETASELGERSPESPARYLFGFGLDRATALDSPDMFAHTPSEDLRMILRAGPPQGIHLLAWWANAATFRSHIGFGGEGFIDILLMLRVDQSTVQELLSPFITWSARDNRALLSDRTQLPEPITVVPFSPFTARDATALSKTEWEA